MIIILDTHRRIASAVYRKRANVNEGQQDVRIKTLAALLKATALENDFTWNELRLAAAAISVGDSSSAPHDACHQQIYPRRVDEHHDRRYEIIAAVKQSKRGRPPMTPERLELLAKIVSGELTATKEQIRSAGSTINTYRRRMGLATPRK